MSSTCASSAIAKTIAACHHCGPAYGVSCGLLRENDNAIERREIDRRFNDCGLIERGVALELYDRSEQRAGMKRPRFGRHDLVADAQLRVLRNVFQPHG